MEEKKKKEEARHECDILFSTLPLFNSIDAFQPKHTQFRVDPVPANDPSGFVDTSNVTAVTVTFFGRAFVYTSLLESFICNVDDTDGGGGVGGGGAAASTSYSAPQRPAAARQRTADEIKAAYGRPTNRRSTADSSAATASSSGAAAEALAGAREALGNRGERLESLAAATEALSADARGFEEAARALRKKAERPWWPF